MKGRHVGADGANFFTRQQAAGYLGVSVTALRTWQQQGDFVPELVREGVHLYTRRQLDDRKYQMPGELAARAFLAFDAGRTPVQAVIELRADPALVLRLWEHYTRMTAAWVVEAPPGGAAARKAWEKTFRVGELTGEKLRRALELVASDETLRAKLLSE